MKVSCFLHYLDAVDMSFGGRGEGKEKREQKERKENKQKNEARSFSLSKINEPHGFY